MNYKLFSYIGLLMLPAALLLTACEDTDIIEQPIENGVQIQTGGSGSQSFYPIQFGISEEASTRAYDPYYVDHYVHTSLPEGSTVGMFGFYQEDMTFDEWNGGLVANFFFNQPMTVGAPLAGSPEVSNLSYTPVRFWPNGDNDMMAFYAYYPYVKEDTSTSPSIWKDANGNDVGLSLNLWEFEHGKYKRGVINFETKLSSKEQIDFMVAPLRADLKREDYIYTVTNGVVTKDGRVPLRFSHKLSRIVINIEFKSIAVYDMIKDIKISGVYTKAAYHPKYFGEESAWQDQNTRATVYVPNDLLLQVPIGAAAEGDYTLEKRSASHDLTYDIADAEDWANKSPREAIFLLIPQRCYPPKENGQEGQRIEITLRKSGTNPAEYETLYFGLNDNWRAGRDYVYNFTINDAVVSEQDFYGNAGTPTMGTPIND